MIVKLVSCGCCHTAVCTVCTEDLRVYYTFGRGEYGQLGSGDDKLERVCLGVFQRNYDSDDSDQDDY